MYFTDGVLLGSLWNALYCRLQEHKGKGLCDLLLTRTNKRYGSF